MAAARKKRWSQRVTETSDALTLEKGVFTRGSARAPRQESPLLGNVPTR